jgi:hypothetical protein
MIPLPNRNRRIGSTVAALALISSIGGLLLWRASLPNNRYQGHVDFAVVKANGVSYYLPNEIGRYEDGVARTTAYNFARDGFLKTHFLPNRGGYPRVSMYDFTGTDKRLNLLEWAGPEGFRGLSEQRLHLHALSAVHGMDLRPDDNGRS